MSTASTPVPETKTSSRIFNFSAGPAVLPEQVLRQAQQAIASEAVRIIETYINTGEVPNCINRAASTAATTLLTVRHLNRPGVLAHVFYTLGQAGINVEEMENVIYDGAKAACARIQLDDVPEEAHLNAISANESVLNVTLTQIPGDGA